MYRRSLLIGLAAVAASQVVACQRNSDNVLRVAAQRGALPPQILGNFKDALQAAVALKVRTPQSLADLFQQLQLWHAAIQTPDASSAPNSVDWVCLSDYWLLPAIRQELISPLDNAAQLSGWETLPPAWSTLLQRNQQGLLAADGPVWGTPYRWQHLMMVYDRRRFTQWNWEPTTWADLLRPELQERISLPDHPRLVLGLLLKALNHSANVSDPTAYGDVVAAVEQLRSQVKVYATTYYLQSLIIGDLTLAVGWSNDILPLLSRYPYLQAVSPAPGTLLSADVWAKPNLSADPAAAIALTDLDQQWLQYWWQPDVVTPLSLFAQSLSPLLLSPAVVRADFDLSAETLIPTAEQLQNSEFIQPLEAAAIAHYNQLWLQLRRGK